MARVGHVVLVLALHAALAVKVKVVMHSEQEDSKPEEEEPRTEAAEHRRREGSGGLPFLKHARPKTRDDDDAATSDKPHTIHPNEVIFPLIYRQTHINSMFKFGENWYTWSIEKRTDGSKATNYYICYDEPKHCDDVGWERADAVPKCAFQIDSLLPEDRACINSFGVEPHNAAGLCDGAEQMKVSDMVRSCGPRIRSLWRFVRVARRPANAVKPADVNSLVCEDEEECFISIEYRIHHDRITFSLHEPTRGQTFKSSLKRDFVGEEDKTTEAPREHTHKGKKRGEDDPPPPPPSPKSGKKFRSRARSKAVEGKGPVKERNDSGYRRTKNKIKVREDVSEDISE